MTTRIRAGVIGALALVALTQGCSPSTDDHRVANQRPTVSITGGPLDGSTAIYTARIYWAAWDADGAIDHFEYALDPPPEMSLDEIMDPVGAGLSVTLVPGPTTREDTLVVAKSLADGRIVSFRWVGTTAFSQSFLFQTPHADSLFQPSTGTLGPRPTFSGVHTVYLRAMDNEGLYSRYQSTSEEELPPFRLGFNARSTTPTARILSPRTEVDLLNVGTTFTVQWDGDDPDSPHPDGKPAGYLYKVLNLTQLGINCLTVENPNFLYFFTNENDSGWTYQPGDTLSHTFRLPNNRCFMMGVRAVDVAGAVEPFLEFGRNAFKFRTVPNAGWPVITITESSLGSFTYTYPNEPVPEQQAAVGEPLRFNWAAVTESYGGTLEAYSWGWDVPDLTQEGPGSRWNAWGTQTSSPSIVIDEPGTHVLALRARDTAGTINVAQLVIKFVPFTLDREVLYMDDFTDGVAPRDSTHDGFWLRLFDPVRSEGRFMTGEVFRFDSFGPNDVALAPRVPTLEELGRYKLIVWSVDGGGGPINTSTALLNLAGLSPLLGAYLRAGGHLWVSGVYTVAATLPTGNRQADLTYPKERLAPGGFAWDYLKIQSTRVDNDKGVDLHSTFSRAIPADSLLPFLPHIYEPMHVDWGKFGRQTPGRGVSFVDAIFDPIFAEADAGFGGDLDTLYVYGSAGQLAFGGGSRYHHRICALRWHDPDPAREHGRVQWFGFPMYYFHDDQAQDTFNKSIDWFREETPNAP